MKRFTDNKLGRLYTVLGETLDCGDLPIEIREMAAPLHQVVRRRWEENFIAKIRKAHQRRKEQV